MKMIKETAEAVMQLLRILLTLLMNQVQTQVEEDGEQWVPNEHALQIQTLMQEVQSQKVMLQEISKNMKMPGATSPSHAHPGSEWSELSEREILQWEDEMIQMTEQAKTTHPSTPTRMMHVPTITSMPKTPSRAAPTGATGVRSRAPGTPQKVPQSPAGALSNEEPTTGGEFLAPNGRDLAWTQDAMTSWGRKVMTWGKKHPGKMYYQVYEADEQYVSWCLSRINSLNMPILDFAKYAQVRRQMEAQIHGSL